MIIQLPDATTTISELQNFTDIFSPLITLPLGIAVGISCINFLIKMLRKFLPEIFEINSEEKIEKETKKIKKNQLKNVIQWLKQKRNVN